MHFIQTINTFNQDVLAQVPNACSFVFCFWLMYALNQLLQGRLLILGITPRRLVGLPGIFIAPWLHAGFDHLFFNSLPLLVLSDLLLTQGFVPMIRITLAIMSMGGLGTWLFGRRAIHVGASGLIMGYMGYLLSEAYLGHSPHAWISAVVVLYYFGSSLLSLLPSEEHISFEGHLFGFLAGMGLAFYPVDFFDTLALKLAPDIYELFQTIQSFF